MEIYARMTNTETGTETVLIDQADLDWIIAERWKAGEALQEARDTIERLRSALDISHEVAKEWEGEAKKAQEKLDEYRHSWLCFWWLRFMKAIRSRWYTFLDNLESDEELDDYESD